MRPHFLHFYNIQADGFEQHECCGAPEHNAQHALHAAPPEVPGDAVHRACLRGGGLRRVGHGSLRLLPRQIHAEVQH